MKTLQIVNITKATSQDVVGEPICSTACLVHWAGWVANPANAAQDVGAILWGFSADQCVFPIDWSLPHVPGGRYDLSKIYIKAVNVGDGVIVCGAA